ncbi:MAG: dephospho-CoA kinase [Candidatus Zixiibacteriota bacterium]|nr:MAG: dephospho-CoA kinase [candidate division Zixibacteria bacterium]
MVLIGLTGTPGAGKSLAAEYLRRKGAIIISGDDTGREVLETYSTTLKKLIKTFGKEILDPDGSLDRKSLGKIVFADSRKLKKLNSIIHPYLLRLLKSKINKYRKSVSGKVVVVDAALIFEWGIESWFDYILVISANRANRIKRLTDSGLSKKEALDRISSQLPQRQKEAGADFVIENNCHKTALRNRVYSFLKSIRH